MAAHRYWRLRIHSTHSADVWCGVATLNGWAAGFIDDQMLSSLGVVCTATSTWSGFPSTNANDNNNATSWLTGTFADPTDLKFDFGPTAGNWRDIRQISFTGRFDSTWYLHYPKNYEWQWSDDDITYTTSIGPLNTPAPTGPGQFYTSPSVGPAGFERIGSVRTLAAATVSSLALRVVEGVALTAINFPSPFERVSQAFGVVTVKPVNEERVSEAAVLVAVRGRTSNPKLRAWTFTLDGHDFYVLRLGTFGTLVYDVYSEQWMDWDAYGEKYWPVNVGFNWVDGQGALSAAGSPFGSNVLVGDDTYPLLYFLDPNQPYDENPEVLDPQLEIYFERVLQGQVVQTGRQVQPCYAVWLTTDMGAPAYPGAGVLLEISDDAGKTYDDMGTVTVTVDENSPELSWYSLGQIAAPGRLFRLTDDGAVARIDSFEMNDPDDSGKQ